MRVIAGSLKGRRLKSPTWEGLRPTSDKLRETLFNVIGERVVRARVLDVCGGAGAVGIEARSGGPPHSIFVESDRRAQPLVAETLAACRIEPGYTMVRSTARRAWATLLADPAFVRFDLILLAPPY